MRRILCMIMCLMMTAFPLRASGNSAKYAALTFDDGPSGRFTRRLLDGLEQRQVHATFFLCGYRLEQMPQLARRIAADGHEIALHGYSHTDMHAMSRREIAREITQTQDRLPQDVKPAFLRPPGGSCSDAVRQVTEATGLAIIQWSLDPRDWAQSDSDAVTRYILKNIHDGDIILLHDMSDSSVDAALAVIDALTPQGWTFVTVGELARLRHVTPEPGKIYYRFPPENEK